MNLTICAVNYEIRLGRGPHRFAERMRILARDAASSGAHLLVLPEYLTFEVSGEKRPERLIDEVLSFYDRYVSLFRELAGSVGIHILAGTTAEPVGRHYYNTAHLFTPTGDIIRYRKMHMHAIDRALGFRPGSEPRVASIGGVPVGIEVCYDLGFPELSKAYGLMGALGILAPAMAPSYGAYMWLRYCCQARAIEMQGFSVLATGVITEPGSGRPYSMSAIMVTTDYKHDGVIAEGDSIVKGRVDIDRLLLVRSKTMAPVIRDTRADVCSLLTSLASRQEGHRDVSKKG
ncbi:hypothetical protein B6U99_00980 [Candidatus Geothermarchaeota archaeon ex4572_27]|nr:MAG: hypothetical protein B6U99_00980 [Candidatus Geothermarchaeota archaeon ex4572_27]